MSTAARKARKRAGERLHRKPKKPTRPRPLAHEERGLGLISGPEILARILARRA